MHAVECETLCYTHLAAELRNTTAHTLRCPAAKVTLNRVAASCTFPQTRQPNLETSQCASFPYSPYHTTAFGMKHAT
jgi:hypothetical protein